MSLTLLAAVMALLLVLTIASALWRCSHPFRMRYRRCQRPRTRAGLCKSQGHRHAHLR